MREHGAEGMAFEPASRGWPALGGAASQPDRPADRRGRAGLDRLRGPAERLLRRPHPLVLLGPADERFAEIYGIVLRAQETAIEGLRAGLTGSRATRSPAT